MFKNPCAHRKVFFTISIILVVVSILSMALRGFNLGIDFTSGTTFEIEHMPEGFVYDGQLEETITGFVTNAKSDASVQVQAIGSDGVFIKASELTNEETEKVVDSLLAFFNGEEVSLDSTDATAVVEEVSTEVVEEVATDVAVEDVTEAETAPLALAKAQISIDKVSATTSDRLIANTFMAVLVAVALMLVYISFRFDFKSGVSAVMALAHDVILMFGFYSIFQFTMNTSFVAAVLTIIGYSINATIVVFDRVRENNKTMRNVSYDEKADKAIKTSYTRTLYSSLTTLFTIGALFVLGVSSIQEFALPIIVGIVCGAYSSLFVAPTFWAFWKNSSDK